jgi:SPFH domain / Band 7 family
MICVQREANPKNNLTPDTKPARQIVRYTIIMSDSTRADRIIRQIKDHRVLGVLFVVGAVATAFLILANNSLDFLDRINTVDATAQGKREEFQVHITFQDGIEGNIDVSVILQLLPENVLGMHQEIGSRDDAEKMLSPMISGCIVSVLEAQTYRYFAAHRSELEEQILEQLKGKAEIVFLTIHDVTLGEFFRGD